MVVETVWELHNHGVLVVVRCSCVLFTTEQDDYNITEYNSFIQLHIPENMTSQVLLNFPPDNNALEGTERLVLRLQLSANTQAEVTAAGNIFFQNTSIQIRDTTGN